MRNIILATATGLVLAVSFIGGWATSTSQARVATLAGDPIAPLQIMTGADPGVRGLHLLSTLMLFECAICFAVTTLILVGLVGLLLVLRIEPS